MYWLVINQNTFKILPPALTQTQAVLFTQHYHQYNQFNTETVLYRVVGGKLPLQTNTLYSVYKIF
jgi:hypothetical protein